MIGKQIQYTITEYLLNPADERYEVNSRVSRFCRRPTTLDYYSHCLTFNSPEQEVSIGIDRPYPGAVFKKEKLDSLVVHFILDGKGTLNGKPFQSGTCFFLAPGQSRSLSASSEYPFLNVWFSIRGTGAERLLSRLEQDSVEQSHTFSHSEQVLQLASFFLYDCSYTYNASLFLDGAIKQFTSFIHLAESARMESEKSSTHIREIVNFAIAEIDKKLADISVTTLAADLHLERKYFSKIFFEVMGVTPQEYILQCKMTQVERYLIETDFPIEKILTLVGYNHRNSLTATFKKQFGCSPTAYRELKRNAHNS